MYLRTSEICLEIHELQSVTKIFAKITTEDLKLQTTPENCPDQSMLRIRLWKLMQHWCNIDWKNKGWGATKLISIWIRVWQRYFVTDCLKKLEMYILSLRWYFESIEIGTAAYSRSCLFHKTIFLNWLTLYKRKVK